MLMFSDGLWLALIRQATMFRARYAERCNDEDEIPALSTGHGQRGNPNVRLFSFRFRPYGAGPAVACGSGALPKWGVGM